MINFVVDGDILGLLNSFLVSTRVLVEIPIGQSIQLPTQYEVPWHIMASFLTAAPTALLVVIIKLLRVDIYSKFKGGACIEIKEEYNIAYCCRNCFTSDIYFCLREINYPNWGEYIAKL